jgi:transposase-like protein
LRRIRDMDLGVGLCRKSFVSEFQLLLPGIRDGGNRVQGQGFDRSVILLCVRWYLAYSLSLRDLAEMMAERGVEVDHATIPIGPFGMRHFCWSRSITANGPSAGRWHVDETYIKVHGR